MSEWRVYFANGEITVMAGSPMEYGFQQIDEAKGFVRIHPWHMIDILVAELAPRRNTR